MIRISFLVLLAGRIVCVVKAGMMPQLNSAMVQWWFTVNVAAKLTALQWNFAMILTFIANAAITITLHQLNSAMAALFIINAAVATTY